MCRWMNSSESIPLSILRHFYKVEMKSELDEFLDSRRIADPLRSAFIAYCKSLYGSRYMFKSEGETVKLFLTRMTDEQVLQAWNDFIRDVRSTIPTIAG